uniref:Uncharacterized protein n=1 Tax=viral metagenome TaxID=1070528 RepID=A0A6C0HFY8_9ZZZZ
MGPVVNHNNIYNSTAVNDLTSGIYYKFEEKEEYENKIINVDEFLSEMESSYSMSVSTTSTNSDCDSDSNISHAILELEYSTNYNVKGLAQIMDYYDLSKKNMRKDEMIQMIIMFETDPNNLKIVNRRRRMYKYINELKRDKYFSKFILYTF